MSLKFFRRRLYMQEKNEYDGWDRPSGFDPGFVLKFRLIVVDVCQGGKRVYTSKTLTVNF